MNGIENLNNQKEIILAQIAALQEELNIIEECIYAEEEQAAQQQSYEAEEQYKEEEKADRWLDQHKTLANTFFEIRRYNSYSLKEIAKIIGVSFSTIKNHLRILKQEGFITVNRKRLKNGTYGKNQYQFGYGY